MKSSNLTRIWHPKFNTTVVQYETATEYDSVLELDVNNSSITELVISLDLLLVTNGSSLMITLQHQETKQLYHLHYMPVDLLISVQDDNIYYGLGSLQSLNKWRHLTRDLLVDVQKGIGALKGGDKKSQAATIKLKRSELRVVTIGFLGTGFFDNITLSTYEHMAHFYDGAEWFVNNQDKKTGGW